MFVRKLRVHKDGKEHCYWSLVETVRTADGPRQRTLPTIEGREIWLRRISKLDEEQQKILHQLQLQIPERLEPMQIQKCSENSALA